MDKWDKRKRAALRRKYHTRKKVMGVADRPRLSVYRSNRHIYAQVIDDVVGATLASASTMSKDLREKIENSSNKDAADIVGQEIAKEAISVGIKCVKFDRNRFKYQGRTKVLADAARKAGLVF